MILSHLCFELSQQCSWVISPFFRATVPCHWGNGDLCPEIAWWSHFERSESLIRHWLSDLWRQDHHAVSNLRSRLTQWPGATETSRFLLLGPFAKFRKATISFVMTVRLSASNNLALTGRIVFETEIWICVANMSRNSRVMKIWQGKKGTLREETTYIYDNFLFNSS